MVDYTIKFDAMRRAAQMSIDSAVATAIRQFEKELGDKVGLTAKIARVVAENAMQQFMAVANSELRLIAVEHQRRADEYMMRPPKPFFLPDELKRR